MSSLAFPLVHPFTTCLYRLRCFFFRSFQIPARRTARFSPHCFQRNSLGWDGHSLKTFADCFSGAVAGATQQSQSQPCPAEGDATPAAVVAADEHQQRPPEFSKIGEEGGVGESDEDGLLPDGGEEKQPGAAATGTLDLHYAGAGIVGSWGVRRVQGGVSAALVDRYSHHSWCFISCASRSYILNTRLEFMFT